MFGSGVGGGPSMKEKKLFAAYENIWERIFLFYSASSVSLLFLWGAFMWGLSAGVWQFGAVCVLGLMLLGYIGYYAFKARVIIYINGIKIMGYPFFSWEHLKKARFVFLTSARSTLSPDEELEIIAAKRFKWQSPWWRRWFLKEDFSKRIIVPYWALPQDVRCQLLLEMGRFIAVPPPPDLRNDEKTRLFLRRIFYILADLMGLVFLVVLGYFVFLYISDFLYLGGNIY